MIVELRAWVKRVRRDYLNKRRVINSQCKRFKRPDKAWRRARRSAIRIKRHVKGDE